MDECVLVKRVILVKPNEMLKFDGKDADKIPEPFNT